MAGYLAGWLAGWLARWLAGLTSDERFGSNVAQTLYTLFLLRFPSCPLSLPFSSFSFPFSISLSPIIPFSIYTCFFTSTLYFPSYLSQTCTLTHYSEPVLFLLLRSLLPHCIIKVEIRVYENIYFNPREMDVIIHTMLQVFLLSFTYC